MWTRNIDTGKWLKQKELLTKENYELLKVDLERVRLYSKCLSGSTYITTNNLDDLYPQLNQSKIGFYSGNDFPSNGPNIAITEDNKDEFYNKYLKEDAFTIKNLFTPEKILEDQLNYIDVDVATTEFFNFKSSEVIIVDGIRLIKGHRLLVKDQKSKITLSSSIDPEDYFKNVLPISSYTISDSIITSITYEYFNASNGVYLYDGKNLTRDKDLSEYDYSYKLALNVKLGDVNADKKFHLERLKNGYFPVEGDNVEFKERQSWVLRHRVDYNNIYDLNYYDIKYFEPQFLFDAVDGKTYSIPERVIAVGEFGVIINNQDKYSSSATFSVSNIISNKYKVNLRSVDDIKDYYWVCGDEGVLLKISKIDFSIQQYDLGEDLNLTSVSFYDDLYGMVVGKFNRIYYTRNGGWTWNRISFPEFSQYSYNKVLHTGPNQAYIGGEVGVFIELTYSNETWICYRRSVSKFLNEDDEYGLVEDINDIYKTNFVNISPITFSETSFQSPLLLTSIYYNAKLNINNQLEISLTHSVPSSNDFYIYASFSYPNGSNYVNSEYEQTDFGSLVLSNVDFDKTKNIATFSLPLNQDGNIYSGTYSLSFNIWNNFTQSTFTQIYSDFSLNTKEGNLLLITANNELVIGYDINRCINLIDNDFIYLSFSQSIKDAMTISRRPQTNEIYLGADKIYSFKINELSNNTSTTLNVSNVQLNNVSDYFVNKIYTLPERIYTSGNSSLLKFGTYSTTQNGLSFVDLDPEFNSRIKSKFLVLDYDIGSKLNFFDDNRNYRLPNTVSFDFNLFTSSGTTFSLTSLPNEVSWMDYFSDSEKTFIYNTHMEDLNVVKFSNQWSYDEYADSFTVSKVANTLADFGKNPFSLAPHFEGSTFSEFIDHGLIAASIQTDKDLFLYKNLAIIKRSFVVQPPFNPFDYTNFTDKSKVGDVLNLVSDTVEANLLINRISYYAYPNVNGPGTYTATKPLLSSIGTTYMKVDTFLYCYSDFNENIINNLKKTTKPIYFKNLNRYKSQDDLISNFNLHPYGLGYKLTKSNSEISITPIFNEKTAYYNLQSRAIVGDSLKDLVYKESFLDFGFSPTYNLKTYLNKINPDVFTDTKEFKVLPKLYNLVGNDKQSASDDNLTIDSTRSSNWIRFGKNLELEWRSLLLNTFVDITIKSDLANYDFEQYLIIEKYYDSSDGGYYLKFNQKMTLPKDVGAKNFDILSRNSISKISKDLQLLNNIQRSTIEKTVDHPRTFTNFESSIKTKFSTHNYLKALVCDYDIKKNISAILYNDSEFRVSMNVLNVEKELTYEVFGMNSDNNGKLIFWVSDSQNEIKVGELIFLEIDDTLDSPMQGLQTVIGSGLYITTSMDYQVNSIISTGRIRIIKKDPFFNYQPIDLFRAGSDRKVTRSVEIFPKNVDLNGNIYSLINVNFNNFKIQFVDGLSLEEVSRFYHWILEAEVSNALIGKNENGIVWYSGTWRCGRWFNGTWVSGTWLNGDWYGGTWNAFRIKNNVVSVVVDTSFSDRNQSIWYNGRWFEGTWNNGVWYNGRRYAGDWIDGVWFNGIWNDGFWNTGRFLGGIWVQGTWNSGVFNCLSKPSFWLDGKFQSGDFENGIWYNGVFGNNDNRPTRFGTYATNTRTATWNAGNWLNGEFHSYLTIDQISGNVKASEIHKFSIWKTGNWNKGDWYGGIAFNINFKNGTWHGGILEEIQVIGIDPIEPAQSSNNKIYLNGIFRFNPGDEIYILDDDRNTPFSPLGSNTTPRKYRIIRAIEDEINNKTEVYLNYDLSKLGVDPNYSTNSFNNVDLGIRVVSYFKEITWKTGLWTNGIFDGGKFDSGIWYNGVFDGIWGN